MLSFQGSGGKVPEDPAQSPHQGEQAVEKGPIALSAGRRDQVELRREAHDPPEKEVLLLKGVAQEKQEGNSDHNQCRVQHRRSSLLSPIHITKPFGVQGIHPQSTGVSVDFLTY